MVVWSGHGQARPETGQMDRARATLEVPVSRPAQLAGYVKDLLADAMEAKEQADNKLVRDTVHAALVQKPRLGTDWLFNGRAGTYLFGHTQVDKKLALSVIRPAIHYGIPPDLLMGITEHESQWDPEAKPFGRVSNALGLHQFLPQTWLGMVLKYGNRIGLEREAEQIVWRQTKNGPRLHIDDANTLQRVLDVRKDANASSLMAVLNMRDSIGQVNRSMNREMTENEFYLVHFLGVKGAKKFLTALEMHPNAKVTRFMRKSALRNRSVFYTRAGIARTVRQTYDHLVEMSRDLRRKYVTSLEIAKNHGFVTKIPVSGPPSAVRRQTIDISLSRIANPGIPARTSYPPYMVPSP